MTTEKKNSIIKLIISVSVIGLLVLAVYFVTKKVGLRDITKEEIQEIIESQGAKAPLAFILLSFLQVTLIPVPAIVTILAGNYVFGIAGSFLYSYIGMFCGAMTAFALGKLIGRPFVNWIVGSKEKVDDWLYKIKGKEGVLIFFLFLVPLFPDDVLCAIAGLLPFSFLTFAGIQLITRALSIFVTLLFMSGQMLTWDVWGISALILVIILFIVSFVFAFKYTDEIEDFFSSLFRKVYYGEPYFLQFKEGAKPGKRIHIDKKFATKSSPWRIAGLYICEEGFVIDIYSYSQRKRHLPEVDFTTALTLDGEYIPCEESVRHLSHARKKGKRNKDFRGIRRFVKHYKTELFTSRVFLRCFYKYDKEITPEQLKKLYLEVEFKSKAGSDTKIFLKLAKDNKSLIKTVKLIFSKNKTKKS